MIRLGAFRCPSSSLRSLLLFFFGLLLVGCATVNTEISELSDEFWTSLPQKVVVLPIQNETVDLDAPEVFRPRVQTAVMSRGYQVPSIDEVDAVLAEQGLTDPGQINAFSSQELGELFQADAVLYTIVTEWRTTYLVFYSVIGVGARFELVDTKTDEVLWKWEKAIYQRMIAIDRETAVATAVLALMPYQPYVQKLVDLAFFELPARKWR